MNLVTGATGLLGSHVVLKLLQQGKTVVAGKREHSDVTKVKELFSYYVPNADDLFNKIKWVNLDVSDIFSIEDALDGIENVYHCAGFVSFQEKDIEKMRRINEIGTANLVNGSLSKNIKAFCHVSSLSTINNNDYSGQLTERVFWKTSGKESAYTISKYNSEREVWRGIEEGLNAVIVNPGIILAPGYWDQSSGKLFSFCKKGNRFYTDGSTGYVSAMDVAEAMTKLIDKCIFNERFILIEGIYSFKDILTSIQKAFNKQPPKIKIGLFLLHLGRIMDSIFSKLSGKDRILTKEIVQSSIGHKDYSNEKIRNTIQFTFSPINSVIETICSQLNSVTKGHKI